MATPPGHDVIARGGDRLDQRDESTTLPSSTRRFPPRRRSALPRRRDHIPSSGIAACVPVPGVSASNTGQVRADGRRISTRVERERCTSDGPDRRCSRRRRLPTWTERSCSEATDCPLEMIRPLRDPGLQIRALRSDRPGLAPSITQRGEPTTRRDGARERARAPRGNANRSRSHPTGSINRSRHADDWWTFRRWRSHSMLCHPCASNDFAAPRRPLSP